MQFLQVTHADHVPQVRTPRLSGALDGLQRAGVLSPAEYADLVGAYNFFRRLINALRMLHGSARDLVLPAIDSDEYLHLTRRMEYEPNAGATPAQQLHDEFADRTEFVRDFIRAHFDRPCPQMRRNGFQIEIGARRDSRTSDFHPR